jgi:multimeric flavodoxin WrbA
MIIRKLGDKKPNVVLFQGSPRDKETCSGMDSKSETVVNYLLEQWSPFINFKVIDLSVNQNKRPTIQPCKGCVSTAGGYHCHFPCSCYNKGDKKMPDLLHELDVYKLLQECDAFIIVSPIHWHSLTSQIKLLFDRLVCINLTMDVWDAINVIGREGIKDSKVTGKLSKDKKYDSLLRNHLEGKVAGFYVHGDDGADDYSNRELPPSYDDVMDDGFQNNPKNVVMPFINQLKYSGVYVPDELVQAFYTNRGVGYYTANLTVIKNREIFERADQLMDNLLNYLSISDKK